MQPQGLHGNPTTCSYALPLATNTKSQPQNLSRTTNPYWHAPKMPSSPSPLGKPRQTTCRHEEIVLFVIWALIYNGMKGPALNLHSCTRNGAWVFSSLLKDKARVWGQGSRKKRVSERPESLEHPTAQPYILEASKSPIEPLKLEAPRKAEPVFRDRPRQGEEKNRTWMLFGF